MKRPAEHAIDGYIQLDPNRPSPDEALVLPARVKVWAVVGQWRAVNGDIERVARGYDLPTDAVRATLAYYDRHRTLIDNRLDANVTPAARGIISTA